MAINLTINGKAVSVEDGTTILQAAEKVGAMVPHYCYHPGLSKVGNCRMCLVEVEKMPKPVASCVMPVSEGMVVKTETENIVNIRKSVMEFLLINHPLDCPTCDQAGECRLQDYYMGYDRIPSRFKEEKVHKDKMIDLGAGVMLDQERCIACTRCIRVCQEVAKKDELVLANRGDHVTITTFPGKKLTNPYAGNTIDVCPVGALTNKDFRYKKRVWLLSHAKSVCPGCSRGCNIDINHADGKVFRLLPRYNADVNQYWMCDEGRYGYKPINENRVLRPTLNKGSESTTVSAEEAISNLIGLLGSSQLGDVGIVGHAQETNESLKAFHDFGMNVLKTRFAFYSRHEVSNPSHDDILMMADKNPNQAGVDALQFKPMKDLKGVKALIVLNDLSKADAALVEQSKVPVLALFAQNESDLSKKVPVVFPIPSYAEQEGSFTNAMGMTQKISKAFEPRGESQLLTSWLKQLSLAIQKNEKLQGAA